MSWTKALPPLRSANRLAGFVHDHDQGRRAGRRGVSTATVSAVMNNSAYVSPELAGPRAGGDQGPRLRPSLVGAQSEERPQPAHRLRRRRPRQSRSSRASSGRRKRPSRRGAIRWSSSTATRSPRPRSASSPASARSPATASCWCRSAIPTQGVQARRRRPARSRPCSSAGRSRTTASDTVTLDNISAGRQATSYLLDLGHRRIGTITGPLHLSTGQGRLDGMLAAMKARGLAPEPQHVRSRRVPRGRRLLDRASLLQQPDPPTALYVANGVMALGVDARHRRPRAPLPGGHLDRLDRHHPGHRRPAPAPDADRASGLDMTNEAVRLLVDRIAPRRRRRGAERRVPADAGRRRQLRAVSGVSAV